MNYQFIFDESFYLTSVARFLRTQRAKFARQIILALALLGSVLLAAGYFPRLAIVQGIAGGGVISCVTIVALRPVLLRWRALRIFRNLPQRDLLLNCVLTAEGVSVESPVSSSRYQWKAYSEAARFTDGHLLLLGSLAMTWLPDAAIVSGETTSHAESFIREHVANYQSFA